jgi:hypothetical protein
VLFHQVLAADFFFSKVEGVPALVQQWEVSWDDTLDPAVSYKIGQVGSLQL